MPETDPDGLAPGRRNRSGGGGTRHHEGRRTGERRRAPALAVAVVCFSALVACGGSSTEQPAHPPTDSGSTRVAPPSSDAPAPTASTAASEPDEPDTPSGAGFLPDPTGPTLRVEGAGINYPFEMQGIGWDLDPEIGGNLAPAGDTYAIVVFQIRPILGDRSSQPPLGYTFDLQWPSTSPCLLDDPYACSAIDKIGQMDMLSDWFPHDSASLPPAPAYGASDVLMPPGSAYDVALLMLIREGQFDMTSARLTPPFDHDGLYIPLAALPSLQG